MAGSPVQKRYAGSTTEERVALRRRQLVLAAIKVYSELGYANASVKAVCAEAGLTERYFYESFRSSEEVLVAAFESVTAFLLNEMSMADDAAGANPAARVRALLHAFFSLLKSKPDEAQVFLVESSGVTPKVDTVLQNTSREVAQRLAQAGWGRRAEKNALIRAAVVGGLMQMAIVWIADRYSTPVNDVVKAAMRVCSVLGPTPL